MTFGSDPVVRIQEDGSDRHEGRRCREYPNYRLSFEFVH